MLNFIVAGGIAASMLAVTSGLAAPAESDAAAPDGAAVSVVTVNGSGCPAGEGAAVISGFNVTITSPAYFASAGGVARPTDFRKNCLISLAVTRPEGWTFAVTRVRSSGYAFLTAGATATSRVSFFFQGATPTTALSNVFTGPMADSWATSDTVDPASRIFASCDTERNLNINTEARIALGTADPAATNFIARNSETNLRLTWRRCPAV